MIRHTLFAALLCLGCYTSVPAASAATGQENPVSRGEKAERPLLAAVSSDRTYRSCRRQVRRAVGYIPRVKFRMPRAYPQMIDRCIANGGVYS